MIMKVKKFFSAVFVLFFVVCSLSALSIDFTGDSSSTRSPDSTKRRDDDLVGVIIRTNVEGAEVYINGKLFGTTPFATVDLSASYYTLELRKSGYDTIKCKIYPRKRYTYTYEFVMQKTCGFITIKNYPTGSYVYVDGSRYSTFPIEVTPGNHTVKVRKFGYEDYTEQVYVENHKSVTVSVSLKTAPFRIRNFSISRNQINPDYTSWIGKVNFSFEVTNDGSAILSVCDYYGNAVWTHEYNSFSTWNQSISWNGRDNYGNPLPDGQYTVNLYSFDFDQSLPLTINRGLVYPLSSFTPSGSGLGSLPCAFGGGENYVKLFLDFGPMIDLSGEKGQLYSLPVTGGVIIDFGHYNELSFAFGGGTATQSPLVDAVPAMASVSYKRNISTDLAPNLKLNFAPLINYNYCSQFFYGPLGSNIGTGLGLGLAMGLEGKTLYLGASGEYFFGATKAKGAKYLDDDSIQGENILKYGLVLSANPSKNLRTSVWGAMYNNEILEGGLEFIAMPGTGAFCFNAKASLLTDITSDDKNMLINAKFGLSILF